MTQKRSVAEFVVCCKLIQFFIQFERHRRRQTLLPCPFRSTSASSLGRSDDPKSVSKMYQNVSKVKIVDSTGLSILSYFISSKCLADFFDLCVSFCLFTGQCQHRPIHSRGCVQPFFFPVSGKTVHCLVDRVVQCESMLTREESPMHPLLKCPMPFV